MAPHPQSSQIAGQSTYGTARIPDNFPQGKDGIEYKYKYAHANFLSQTSFPAAESLAT